MAWKQLEPTGPHLTYLFLSAFLILYALFSLFIRNRLHLSEPPLATLAGIVYGPKGLDLLNPVRWGHGDNVVQELTRIVVGIQCFAVGVELPKHYFARHWRSVAVLLGPVMTFGWVVSAFCVWLLFRPGVWTSLVISACLTPTDPVLAASMLSNSQFSTRVPARIKNMLSAESGCNDGVSFPFLYIGLAILTRSAPVDVAKKWVMITLLWQCAFGILLGLVVGYIANRLLRVSHNKSMIGTESYLVFYLLLALFSIGLASTLGTDDFLLAFGAGVGFARDGWFASETEDSHLPNVIDLVLNSTMFVFFGTSIPWEAFNAHGLTPLRLLALLVLILLFRRIPIVLALKRWIPDIRTYREALFAGHFGPMGVGALFLAIEARAQLETDSSEPLPSPPDDLHWRKQRAVDIIWPIICFIVLGSTMVHGLSTLAISVGLHYRRHEHERAPLLGGETERLGGMVHEDQDRDSIAEGEA